MDSNSMRQAITVKYHGPTNRRDARLSTTIASGVRRYWPLHSLPDDTETAYRTAARHMQEHLGDGWAGVLHGGWTGEGVAVFTLGLAEEASNA